MNMRSAGRDAGLPHRAGRRTGKSLVPPGKGATVCLRGVPASAGLSSRLEGVALLRAFAGDDLGREFVEARIAETRVLLDGGAAVVGRGSQVGQVGTVDGYRAWAEAYDEPGNPLIAVEEPVVRQILSSLPAGSALDAACGTRRHAEHLAARGHRVTGVDSSPDMLARARLRRVPAQFLLGDLHRMPLRGSCMDLVVCALALVHVPALAPVMAEFARVLRPGGHLVISDIHLLSLYLGGVATAAGPGGRRACSLRAGSWPATTWPRRCRSGCRYAAAGNLAGPPVPSRAARWPGSGARTRPTPPTPPHRRPSSGTSSEPPADRRRARWPRGRAAEPASRHRSEQGSSLRRRIWP
jgi:SAM-dependent methyltransferase